MPRFNDSNVETRFIQNILKNTYLPILPTVGRGDFLVEGADYVYKNNIIHCTKSGSVVVEGEPLNNIIYVNRSDSTPKDIKKCASAGDFSICSSTFICGKRPPIAEYSIVRSFSYSNYEPGITYQYCSNSSRYDANLHYQLGKYLRWYRDTKNIDLMSLYNCFTGEDTSFVHLKDGELKSGNDASKTTWIVPVQLNKDYNIYVNSFYPVSVGGVFLNKFGRVKQIGKDKKFLDELLESTTIEQFSSSYRVPISFRAVTNNPDLISYSNNFYLIIQTDKSHNSSIVVIEGKTPSNNNRVITSREVSLDTQNYKLFNPDIHSSLALFPSAYHLPYSNKLIEYLTEHTITSEEDVTKNVERVQSQLGVRGKYMMTDDVWDEVLKFILYNEYFNYTNDYYIDSASFTQDVIKQFIKDKNIPEDMIVYLKNEYGAFLDMNGNVISNEEGDLIEGADKVIIGLKNCKVRQDFTTKYDILGYVDKDVENSLFKYRSVF